MKRRDAQITLRLAGELRVQLEAEADECGRSLADQIRRILIDHTAQRVLERRGDVEPAPYFVTRSRANAAA